MGNIEEMVTWINAEVERRDWSYRELGRRSGISVGAISKVMTGSARPGLDFCVKVARAFGVPAHEVLELAGLIPPQRITEEDRLDPLLREIIAAWPALDKRRKEFVRNAVDLMLEQMHDVSIPSPAIAEKGETYTVKKKPDKGED